MHDTEWVETIGDDTEVPLQHHDVARSDIADTPSPPIIGDDATDETDLQAIIQYIRSISREEGKAFLRSLSAVTRHALASRVTAGLSSESSDNAVRTRQQEDPNQSIEAEREYQRIESARLHDELAEIHQKRAELAEANSRALATTTQSNPTSPSEANPNPGDIEADFGDSSTDEAENLGRFLPGYDGQPVPDDVVATIPRPVEITKDHTGIYIMCPWGYQHFFPTKGMHSSIVAYDPDLASSAWKLAAYSSHLTKYRRSGSTSSLSRHSSAYQLLAKAMVDEMGNKLRDMLGADWLGILLLRSQRLVWHGGQDVRCNPPQPKVSVDALVQSHDKQSSLCYTLARWMYPLQ